MTLEFFLLKTRVAHVSRGGRQALRLTRASLPSCVEPDALRDAISGNCRSSVLPRGARIFSHMSLRLPGREVCHHLKRPLPLTLVSPSSPTSMCVRVFLSMFILPDDSEVQVGMKKTRGLRVALRAEIWSISRVCCIRLRDKLLHSLVRNVMARSSSASAVLRCVAARRGGAQGRKERDVRGAVCGVSWVVWYRCPSADFPCWFN